MLKKIFTLTTLTFVIATNQIFACSSAFVNVYDKTNNTITNTLVARTMDLEIGWPTKLVYSIPGDKNVSMITSNELAHKKAASWETKYKTIGTDSVNNIMSDGINDQGLKVGMLMAPGITEYPIYNENNSKPALSVLNLVNYLLETSKDVDDAIVNLEKVQIVTSSLTFEPFIKKSINMSFHYHLTDKSGNSAVIEFIKGKIEISRNTPILTNSPSYQWQREHYEEVIKNVRSTNLAKSISFDGTDIYLNGNGYDGDQYGEYLNGVPGSTTPVSRFVKASTLRSLQPIAYNDQQAQNSLLGIYNYAMYVPIGANPAPTLWKTDSNLSTGEYKITTYFDYGAKNKIHVVNPENAIRTYNVNDIDTSDKMLKHGTLSNSDNVNPDNVQPDKNASQENIGQSYIFLYI